MLETHTTSALQRGLGRVARGRCVEFGAVVNTERERVPSPPSEPWLICRFGTLALPRWATSTVAPSR